MLEFSIILIIKMEKILKAITLKIKNFHPISEAEIRLNGLSIIGGENGSGKSTVGKLLMALIKTDNKTQVKKNLNQKKTFESYLRRLFETIPQDNSNIQLCIDNKVLIDVLLKNGKCQKFETNPKQIFRDSTFIQTALVWDLQDFFSDITRLQQSPDSIFDNEKISYPYAIYDLYLKLTMRRIKKDFPKIKKISEKVSEIIGGNFVEDSQNRYCFFANNKQIPLLSVASGIKVFGIIQNLINNAYITPQGFFIFDEPENHLHPKWQVEFAKVIIELIKNNICITINTHSPYLLETFQKLKEKERELSINFYLAQNNKIEQVGKDNNKTLESTFLLLNESFAKIDEIDLERIQDNGRY